MACFGVKKVAPQRSIAVRAARQGRCGGWAGRRSLALALTVFTAFAVLLASPQSQAGCSSTAADYFGSLIVRCTDAVCSDGFLVRPVAHVMGSTECGLPFLVMEDFETLPGSVSHMVEATTASAATGVFEITLLNCKSAPNSQSNAQLLSDFGLDDCARISSVRQVDSAGETAALERERMRWGPYVSSSALMAQIEVFRYGVGGLIVEFAAVILAIVAPPFLFSSARNRHHGRIRVLFLSMTMKGMALGYAGWRMSSDYEWFDFGLADTFLIIDYICVVVLLIAMAIELTNTYRGSRQAGAG